MRLKGGINVSLVYSLVYKVGQNGYEESEVRFMVVWYRKWLGDYIIKIFS